MSLTQLTTRLKDVLAQMLSSEGLRAKTMRGGVWLVAGSVAEQVVRFGRNMLLARLLAPGAFGTMAIVLSSAALVDTITDVGQKGAIIQNPRGGESAYLNASWWMGMGRAFFSYLLVFSLAPWIARFYERPELSALLRVTLLGILLGGAMSPRSILAQKELKLARWAWITNGGGICGVILTVVLSFFIRDVWALVIGTCGEQAFRCLLSYALCPGLPALHLDRRAAREILTFSRGIFGLGVLNIIVARSDIFVMGRMYPSAALGLYTMAVSLVMTPSFFITGVLGQSVVPAMASIQTDLARLNRILMEVTSWLVVFGLPAAVSVCLCSPYLLRVAYGSRYVGAAGPLSVACAVVLMTVTHAVVTCVLIAKGRPGVHREAVIINAVTMGAAIYPFCKLLGPIGGQVAALLGISIASLYQLMRSRAVTHLDLFSYARVFVRPALASAGILALVLANRRFVFPASPAVDIALCAGGCIAAYVSCAPALLRGLTWNSAYSLATAESTPVL